jgi:hypothetical protein
MSLVAVRVGFSGLGLALCLVVSCGGQRIRLGDGIGEAGAATAGSMTGNQGGAGGSSGHGGAESIAGSGSAAAGAGGSADEICSRGQVSADEVLWIGESWIIEPGTQRTTVRDLAFAAGTIAANEEYPSSAAHNASMAMIAQQYDTRERGTPKVKVLLMDGGTWDTLAAQMTGSSVAAAIDQALADFQQFLSKVAIDGTVEHIVYFLVPELMNIPGVAEMRPRVRQACDESAVPCHFIDLQEVWEQGDPATYTASNGFFPSAAGGVAIGQAIWATMQAHCIAQ